MTKSTENWVTPEGGLGTNIGSIITDDAGALQFDGGAAVTAVVDNIINVTNGTNATGAPGERVYIRVEFQYTSGDNNGLWNHATAHCEPGEGVYLVVDVAESVDVDVYFSRDEKTWSGPSSVSVSGAAALSPVGTVTVTGDDDPTAYPAVVPENDGSSFSLQNDTGGDLDVWINSRDGTLPPVSSGSSVELRMDQPGVGQWLVGFGDPDPTIVVRRPPISTGSRPGQ